MIRTQDHSRTVWANNRTVCRVDFVNRKYYIHIANCWSCPWYRHFDSIAFSIASILYGAPKYNISKLQRAQIILARVVTRSHRRTSADALLHKLHWLPIEDRIVFKLALLTYKTLLIGSPSYLSTLLTIYRPPRTQRSSNSNLICANRTKTVTGSRAFRCAAPAIWNSLPADIKSACSIESFRTKLKTFLFRQSCA